MVPKKMYQVAYRENKFPGQLTLDTIDSEWNEQEASRWEEWHDNQIEFDIFYFIIDGKFFLIDEAFEYEEVLGTN